MKPYTFIKQGRDWYIDLPLYIEQGGSMGDLQMVDGADAMLDVMAGNASSVTLFISKEPFEGADKLILTEKCEPYIGGGYYRMEQYEGKTMNQSMWLCQVTAFVFEEIPVAIFVKRATASAG